MGSRVVGGKTYGQRLCSALGGQMGEKPQPVLGETPGLLSLNSVQNSGVQ